MACYYPIQAWLGPKNKSGKTPLVFTKGAGRQPLMIPCGQCIGCRLRRSQDWAMRMMHEAKQHEKTCFVTLTYSEENRPKGLKIQDFQNFMKRLRKRYGGGIRYFHCGEYGDQLQRPHYHAILFGVDFDDRKPWRVRNGHTSYRSEILEKLWPWGYSEIGTVTYESCAYVARYCVKKITGHYAAQHYADKDTGEILQSEYCTMSRRPGIAHAWYKKFHRDVFPSGYMIHNGGKVTPPRYYDRLLEKDDPELYEKVKRRRLKEAKLREADNDSFRLPVKEECQMAKLKLLRRDKL